MLILIAACTQKSNTKSEEVELKLNNLSVIIDDQLWNGEIGDSIRNKFALPVIGLPQEEPQFTINQYPIKLLEGFMNKTSNIFIIKKENQNRFEIIENEFIKPQIVIHISGNTVSEIIDLIENNSTLIIGKLKIAQAQNIQNKIKKQSLKNKNLIKKFQVSINIPNTYKCVLKGNNFVWLKNNFPSGSTSILLYQLPISTTKFDQINSNTVLKIRDSIGVKYIHGSQKKSSMQTENSYAPYTFSAEIDQKMVRITKGTWEMKNDFMSGPFVNYCFFDSANKRLLIIEGFCYLPSSPKRDFVTELEAIISSAILIK